MTICDGKRWIRCADASSFLWKHLCAADALRLRAEPFNECGRNRNSQLAPRLLGANTNDLLIQFNALPLHLRNVLETQSCIKAHQNHPNPVAGACAAKRLELLRGEDIPLGVPWGCSMDG